jgi:transcriptional regulator with XRE-family HTH domain
MNVEPRGTGPQEEIWELTEMRQALAARDLGNVFRILQRHGTSQRTIAALTGMSSSEVYEVLRGRRVMAYEVLCRVADGFRVPRGYLGLAYDNDTASWLDQNVVPATDLEAEDDGNPNALLAYAAAVTVGTAGELPPEWSSIPAAMTPMPGRIGKEDIEQVEAVTAGLRVLDYRFGGGACREAVVAHARWVDKLCDLPSRPATATRLRVAAADVHNLAGWTAFDVGLYPAASRHLALALDSARRAGVPSLTANVLYRAGRVYLHRGKISEALRFFQLGQLAAQDSGSRRTVAMLCANIAWTYAIMGDVAQARAHLNRAADEFGHGDSADAEPWVQFFGESDIFALTGMTQLALAQSERGWATAARLSLEKSISRRTPEMARSKAFEQGALASACLLLGDWQAAEAIGDEAFELTRQLRSHRVLDRLRPFGALAVNCADTGPQPDAVRDLGHRIQSAVLVS